MVQVLGARGLKAPDGWPLGRPRLRFTCAGQKLANLLAQDLKPYAENSPPSLNSPASASAATSTAAGSAAGPASKFVETVASNHPSSADPNWLDRLVVPVDLPTDPAMSPTLEIAVLDRSTGPLGFCSLQIVVDAGWHYKAPHT